MNIMNIGAVHDNGEPRLQIGMKKKNAFVIEYDASIDVVVLKGSIWSVSTNFSSFCISV